MTPTWYDILGVERDATPEQIKAAWRESTDKFEPGSGGSRFRMFNEAADILLDPEKRRAYVAEIAGDAGRAPAAPPPPPPPPAPVAEPDESPAESSVPEPPTPVEAVETPDSAKDRSRLGRYADWLRRQSTSTLGLGILGVLATAALVLAVFLAVDKLGTGEDSANGFDPSEGTAASSVAEKAVAAVLAYDYRNLAADRDRALTFLTPEYQETYEKIFDGLINGTEQAPGGAVKTKAVVTASVLSTAVVDADGDTVRVLVFVDQQPTTNGKQRPLLANRVVATMERRDGTWLLDKLDPLSAGF
jgi:Mce-associated membrane protein